MGVRLLKAADLLNLTIFKLNKINAPTSSSQTVLLLEYNNYDDQFDRCFTPEKLPGQCISIKNCPPLIRLLQDRLLPPESARYLKNSHCGFEGVDAKVCCPLNIDKNTEKKPLITTAPKFSYTTIRSPLLPNTTECGLTFNDKLFGGDVAHILEFPWMTLLEYDTRKSRVRLGEYDTNKTVDCVPNQLGSELCSDDPLDVLIAEKIPHELYNPFDKSQKHDIGLLRLSRDVPITDFIRPICVPTSQELQEMNFVGWTTTVSGWGKTENRSESNVKLKLDVPVVSNQNCSIVYRSESVTISDSHLCAGGLKGRDSCKGDSGGPLMNRHVTDYVNWSSRPSYGDDAISYVQLKREGKICTVKCKICPEHKVHAKLYGVTLTVDEDEEKVTSVQCHDCVAAQGGCKHAIALLMWIHRRSEEHLVQKYNVTG
ncbi:hypothetical protein FQA39_LY08039 [Lamprigera yunnana]|nr:hypothetical protein FQA39_LY08039 [Lamprigera yunnana]